jgi:Cu2+-exporting ATPase
MTPPAAVLRADDARSPAVEVSPAPIDAPTEVSAAGDATLRVCGMYCAACSGVIEAALLQVDGVRDARVSASAERATVHFDPARTALPELIAAIRRAGYDAAPDAAAPAAALRRTESRQALWRLFVAWFCMMQVMMLAWPSYIAAPGELPDDLRQLLNWGAWVLSIPVVWWSAAPFFAGAWRAIRTRRIGMDVPVALGVAVTFVASTGATFAPGGLFGDEVYFDSLTMFVAFLLAGRWLEMRARHRAAATLESALAAMPRTALRLAADGSTERVEVQALRPGDRVQVPLGEAFPADGTLLDGPTAADEALLTGESTPVAKAAGDDVVAGSLNAGAPVRMTVERVGADTRYEAIVALMQQALTQRPALARIADRWATPFLWAVLLLAGGAAAAWSVIEPSRAVWVAVSVLIVTCPCALSLAAPSAMTAAAGALARRGVLIRRLDALEPLAQLRQLFVDKTGTLTEDRLQWHATQVLAPSELDAPTLQRAAAALAANSTHPLSRALVDATTGEVPWRWHDVVERPGLGLEAVDDGGVRWRLGRPSWVGVGGDDAAEGGQAGLQLAFGPRGRALVGFEFDERLRDDAAATLRELIADGVQVRLLSGDASVRVERLAARLAEQGVELPVQAAARPQDKLAAVRAAQAGGERVAMVGDGVNDAPVLAQADVSFAMGQGALVARATADAIVVGNRLASLAHARRLAQRTMRVVRQNIVWAALYNASCIPLALMGYLPPWAAGLGMALSSLLVVGNSMRLTRG